MELKTASGLTLHMHSAGNQINLLNISFVKYFAKEESTIIVYYQSCLACFKNSVLAFQNLPVSSEGALELCL